MPCPNCIHREVCSLKAAMEAVPVTLPDRPSTWPRGLELVGTLSVACAMFHDERRRAKRVIHVSAEQRTAASARMKAMRARQEAEKAARKAASA